MDPNPRSFPILSYVTSKLPKLSTDSGSGSHQIDIEQPRHSILRVQQHRRHRQTRSVIQMLGERPDHEAVDTAKAMIAEIESDLSKLQELMGFARFVNIRDGKGATPLHLAARQRRPACVHILLGNGALVCASTGGYSFPGSTPLHLAARGGSLDCNLVRTQVVLLKNRGIFPASSTFIFVSGTCHIWT